MIKDFFFKYLNHYGDHLILGLLMEKDLIVNNMDCLK